MDFSLIAKTVVAPEEEMVTFSGPITEGQNALSTLMGLMATPAELGSQNANVQAFLLRNVPMGKIMRLTAVLRCELSDIPIQPTPEPEPTPE